MRIVYGLGVLLEAILIAHCAICSFKKHDRLGKSVCIYETLTFACAIVFFVFTFVPGHTVTVLAKGLDGESQGNIYQDTLAKLMMNFAVEDNSDPTLSNPPTFTTTTSKVKTGDIWSIASAVVFVIGIILMILAFVSDRKGAKQNEKIA